MIYLNKINKTPLYFSLLFLLSCSNIEDANRPVAIVQCDTVLNLDSSLIQMKIAKDIWNKPSDIIEVIQRDLKGTGLLNYKSGYDSIAIRLWYNYGTDTKEVIEIRKHCSGWNGEYSKIISYTENRMVYNKVAEKRKLNPKSSWNYFTKSIFDLGMITLPDWSDIPDYNPSMDGTWIDVEIATKEYYRIYTYLQPKSKKNIKEANALEAILKLIENEFDFKPIKKI